MIYHHRCGDLDFGHKTIFYICFMRGFLLKTQYVIKWKKKGLKRVPFEVFGDNGTRWSKMGQYRWTSGHPKIDTTVLYHKYQVEA